MAIRALITGANRGLGLELTRQLLGAGEEVVATCRAPDRAAALHGLASKHGDRARVLALDVASSSSVMAAAEALAGERLDWLLNNAGVNPRERLLDTDPEGMVRTLDINAVGPVRCMQAFREHLARSEAPKIVNVSSQLGALTIQRPGFGNVPYNASKAALNMVTRMASFELEDMRVIAVHPGWVQTDMGGPNASTSVEEAAAGIVDIARGLDAAASGGFVVYDGREHPW